MFHIVKPRSKSAHRRSGLSQTFPDQCASCVRGRHDLTIGCGLGFQTTAFLPLVTSMQVRQSATPSQIVRGKTLRQARFYFFGALGEFERDLIPNGPVPGMPPQREAARTVASRL